MKIREFIQYIYEIKTIFLPNCRFKSGLKRNQKKAGTYSMRAALLLAYILCPSNALISLIILNIFLIIDI
jgi:hypothetical protein